MRGAMVVVRILLVLLVVAAMANCGDDPTSPERSVANHAPTAFATASNGNGLSITTDKDDYSPGDTVWFTGGGWTPGDSLDVVLTDSLDVHTWSVGIAENGEFRDSTYVVDVSDLGVTFTLTATSREHSEQTLTVNFTDGSLNGVALDQASRSVPQTGSVNYQVDVSMSGNTSPCSITLSVLPSPALPAGATSSIPGNVVNVSPGNVNFSRTLTINTTGVTPGTYPFTVQAAHGSCQGSDKTAAGTLIVFGTAHHLAFLQQPTNADATLPISPPATVQVLDAGNRVVANSSASIVLAIGANPSGGALSGTATQNAVDGVATFGDLSINKAGTGYTLSASSSALNGATSSPFNITVGSAAQVVFSTQPSGGAPNTAFATQPVVQIWDAGGNVKTTGTGSGSNITLSIVSGTGSAGAVLSCSTNPLGASAGVANFTGCKINLAGTGYRLRASVTIGGNTFTVDSDPFDVAVVNTAAKLAITAPASPYTIVVGECSPKMTVQTQTAGGSATNPGTNVAVDLGTTSMGGAFYSDAICTAAVPSRTILTSGNSADFYYRDSKAGSPTLTVSDHAGSLSSDSQQETINQAATSTAIGSVAPSPATFGQLITVNYSVTVNAPGGGTPTGNVAVKDGSTTLCSGTVTAGSCTFHPAGAGTLSLTATYGGDANFLTSTSSPATPLTVNPAPTTTAISSASPSPSTFGQQVTVNFSVAPSNTGAGYDYQSLVPTGTVEVKDGSDVLCSGTVASGSCQFYPAGAGSLSLMASYAGDANFASSASSPATPLTVNRAPTTTAIGTISPSSPFFGQQITVGFTVVPTNTGPGYNYHSIAPTGTVQVRDGATVLCSANVAAGSCMFYPAGAGTLSLKAYYMGQSPAFDGDANFLASSTASPTSLAVDRAPTITSITSPDDETNFIVNQQVTVSFTVRPEFTGAGYDYGSVVPTGTVQVKDGSTLLCSGSLGSGSGSCNFTASAAGHYMLKAYYLGDAASYPDDDQNADDNFLASQSGGVDIYAMYRFLGLSAPVDRPNTLNLSKAGQAIPLKWQLLDYFNNPVTTLANVTVKVKDLQCNGLGSADQIEEYAAGSSGLQNLGGGYYQFNWKTPGSYASSCKNLALDIGEGKPRDNLAYFTFKK